MTMNRIDNAILTVHKIDRYSKKDRFANNIHPVVKVLLTAIYIVLLMSVDKYNLITTLSMSIYVIILSIVADISIVELLKKFKVIFGLLFIVAVVNPFLDMQIIGYIGIVPITGGIISMITLILKGYFAVIVSLILVYVTSIEKICMALKMLHIPNVMITVIMLIYRYIVLFLKEVQRIWTAYTLRAPGQRGVNYKVWGSMIGSMLIRSIDRAQNVYQSMELRGFNIDTFFMEKDSFKKTDILCLAVCLFIILVIRFVPVFWLVGNAIIR